MGEKLSLTHSGHFSGRPSKGRTICLSNLWRISRIFQNFQSWDETLDEHSTCHVFLLKKQLKSDDAAGKSCFKYGKKGWLPKNVQHCATSLAILEWGKWFAQMDMLEAFLNLVVGKHARTHTHTHAHGHTQLNPSRVRFAIPENYSPWLWIILSHCQRPQVQKGHLSQVKKKTGWCIATYLIEFPKA